MISPVEFGDFRWWNREAAWCVCQAYQEARSRQRARPAGHATTVSSMTMVILPFWCFVVSIFLDFGSTAARGGMARAQLLLRLVCVLLLRSAKLAAGFFASPLTARFRAARCCVGASSVTEQGHSSEPSDDGYDDFDFEAEEDDEEIDIDDVMPSIVRIYAQTAEPNLALPWQRERPFESSGTGFAIALANGTMRVLTNAHVVEHASVLQVRRRGDDRKYEARVVALGAECDLALLQVDDDDAFDEEEVVPSAMTARPNFWDWPKLARRPRGAFWRGAPPLEWGPLPRLQDEVAVVGFPIGGESVSVTAGVVSRIELTDYAQSPGSRLLTLQIDAAINSGNKWGAGLRAFSRLSARVSVHRRR